MQLILHDERVASSAFSSVVDGGMHTLLTLPYNLTLPTLRHPTAPADVLAW